MSDIKKLKDSVYELEGLLELADRRPGKLGVLIPLVEARIEALTNMFYELKPNVDLSVEHVAPAQQPEEDKPVAIAEPVSAVEPEEPGESGETGDDVEELYVIDDAGPAESVVSVEPQLTVAAAPSGGPCSVSTTGSGSDGRFSAEAMLSSTLSSTGWRRCLVWKRWKTISMVRLDSNRTRTIRRISWRLSALISNPDGIVRIYDIETISPCFI